MPTYPVQGHEGYPAARGTALTPYDPRWKEQQELVKQNNIVAEAFNKTWQARLRRLGVDTTTEKPGHVKFIRALEPRQLKDIRTQMFARTGIDAFAHLAPLPH